MKIKNKQGIAALLTIVIISVAVLIMALSASSLGLGELELGYTSQKSGEALAVADSCTEEALRQLRLSASYTGGSFNVGDGSCIITVIASGTQRTITAESTVGDYHKKIQVTATLLGSETAINTWSELTD